MHGTPDQDKMYLYSSPALPSWRALLLIFARKMAAEVGSAAEWVTRLNERARQRHALAALDDRMIEDIGIDRARICPELSKPVWRD